MKAWLVQDLPNYTYAAVVFADTREAARSYCTRDEDVIGEVAYTNVRARRVPKLDSWYANKPVMDWDDKTDRIGLVSVGIYLCSECRDCETCVCRDCCEEEHD